MGFKKLLLVSLLTALATACGPRDVRISTTLSSSDVLEQLERGETIEAHSGMLPTCDDSRPAYSYVKLNDPKDLGGIFSGNITKVYALGERQCFRVGDSVDISVSPDENFGKAVVEKLTLIHFNYLTEDHARDFNLSLEELKDSLKKQFGDKLNSQAIALISIRYVEGSYAKAEDFINGDGFKYSEHIVEEGQIHKDCKNPNPWNEMRVYSKGEVDNILNDSIQAQVSRGPACYRVGDTVALVLNENNEKSSFGKVRILAVASYDPSEANEEMAKMIGTTYEELVETLEGYKNYFSFVQFEVVQD